jgi:hypothetical protein
LKTQHSARMTCQGKQLVISKQHDQSTMFYKYHRSDRVFLSRNHLLKASSSAIIFSTANATINATRPANESASWSRVSDNPCSLHPVQTMTGNQYHSVIHASKFPLSFQRVFQARVLGRISPGPVHTFLSCHASSAVAFSRHQDPS